MKCKLSTVVKRAEKIYNEVKPSIAGKVPNYPVNACYMMSTAILNKLAHPKGWKINLIAGLYKGVGHHWLKLSDGTIIDPTLGQFGLADKLWIIDDASEYQEEEIVV